jgi:hypothetical protein
MRKGRCVQRLSNKRVACAPLRIILKGESIAGRFCNSLFVCVLQATGLRRLNMYIAQKGA